MEKYEYQTIGIDHPNWKENLDKLADAGFRVAHMVPASDTPAGKRSAFLLLERKTMVKADGGAADTKELPKSRVTGPTYR